jgi:hypothetical protein
MDAAEGPDASEDEFADEPDDELDMGWVFSAKMHTE